ncbi:MAG: LptF/LptG family permease [Campylobacterota bacterium]|nr:LptF/LptG family permease [Campylobacterota bacterium]
MKQLQKYIIQNLSILFLSIFLPLFSIASVIFMIKLATYTAVIQIDILELLKLYIFILPELLFYTLPISFFVASTLTLFKLSNDNEIVVLFSLGIHPKNILSILLKPALFLTILLAFNFFILFPHAKVLSKNFIKYKKIEASFNLSASEYGHKFGDWLLYVGDENKNENKTYSNIFLFNKNIQEESIIVAKKAKILNINGILKLKLENGQGYTYSSEKFSQIDFDTLYLNDSSDASSKNSLITYKTPIKYWQDYPINPKKKKMLITNILLSIFPILSLFVVLSIGIVHVRHQKTKIYLYLFLGTLVYYGASFGLQKTFGFYSIPLVTILWIGVSYILYRKTIVAKF